MPDIQSSCGAVHSADSLIGQAGCGASRSAFLLFGMACDIILEVLDWEGIVRFFRHLVYIDQRFRLHRRFGILGEPSPCPHRILCTENEYPWAEAKKKRSLISQASPCGGDSWTRTNDPIDVNDVLYRLSHATTLRFEVPTKVSSHHGRNYKPLSTGQQASSLLKSKDSAFRRPSGKLLKTAVYGTCVPRTQVPYTAVHNASRTQKWAPDYTLVPLSFYRP